MSERERPTPSDADEHDTPIPVSWIAKEDLAYASPERADEIAALSRADMEYIAGKVGDALQDAYWTAIETVLERYFADENEDTDEQPDDTD
jgi:hypothetical protein